MPTLDQHSNRQYIKALYLGDSAAGKTGSLESLVRAGYQLRVLDYDNNLGILASMISHHATTDAERDARMAAVQFVTLRDRFVPGPQGPAIKGPAKAFPAGIDLLSKWEDGSDPQTWGPGHILVVDSLSSLGSAALDWSLKVAPPSNDKRTYYYHAQAAIEHMLQMLTTDLFQAHVLCLTHIRYTEDIATHMIRGHANIIGNALGPVTPRYFPCIIGAEVVGSVRKIKTVPTPWVNLRTPAPYRIAREYPIESGMAALFAALEGDANGKD